MINIFKQLKTWVATKIANKRNITLDSLSLLSCIEIDGINFEDYPDFCDSFISMAVWSALGIELNDKQLDQLNENFSDFVYEQTMEYIF